MGVKRTRLIIALVVALVVASVVSVVIYNFFGPKPVAQVAPAQLPTVDVVVAAAPIRVGTRVKKEHLKTASWPQGNVPEGAYTRVDDVIGRAVLSNVVTHELLVKDKLAQLQAGGGLPAIIPDGRRAMTIRVDDVMGVAGFVLPDTHVDILMTRDIAGALVTKTIMQNMLVLAAGQQLQQEGDRPITAQVVTLSVTPDEAEKLTLASSDGRLQLVLRNPSDSEIGKTSGATIGSVLNGEGPRVPAAPRPVAPPRTEMAAVTRQRPVPPPIAIAPPPRPVYQVEVIKDNLSTVEKFYLE